MALFYNYDRLTASWQVTIARGVVEKGSLPPTVAVIHFYDHLKKNTTFASAVISISKYDCGHEPGLGPPIYRL